MFNYFVFISYNLRFFFPQKAKNNFMHIFMGHGVVGKSRKLKLEDQVLS